MGLPTAPMPPFIASFIRVGGKTLEQHYADVQKITQGHAIETVIEANAPAELDNAKSYSQSIVPVRTGYLRSTIDWAQVSRIVFKFFASADYARYVEEGTIYQIAQPYMLPAVMRLKQRMPDVIIRGLQGFLGW